MFPLCAIPSLNYSNYVFKGLFILKLAGVSSLRPMTCIWPKTATNVPQNQSWFSISWNGFSNSVGWFSVWALYRTRWCLDVKKLGVCGRYQNIQASFSMLLECIRIRYDAVILFLGLRHSHQMALSYLYLSVLPLRGTWAVPMFLVPLNYPAGISCGMYTCLQFCWRYRGVEMCYFSSSLAVHCPLVSSTKKSRYWNLQLSSPSTSSSSSSSSSCSWSFSWLFLGPGDGVYLNDLRILCKIFLIICFPLRVISWFKTLLDKLAK